MATYTRETEGLTLVHKFADQVKGRTCKSNLCSPTRNSPEYLQPLVLLTGPTPGGIGAETLLSLAAESPALLILVGRSQTKAQATIDAIKKVNASVKTKFVEADLASLRSVRAAAQAILADAEIARIDVVVNNAAVMATPFRLTEDGLELQLHANHLGHFVLTNTIAPKIRAAGPGARVVNVSSSGHRLSGVRFEDPNWARPGSYSEMDAYGQSKTANVLFATALNRRGVRAYALHPGGIMTNLQDHVKAMPADKAAALFEEASQRAMGRPIEEQRKVDPWKTLQQGCGTTIRAALDPDLVKEEGVYLVDTNLTTDPQHVKEWATDPELAEKLWKLSEELVGQKFDI
ncbi:NAD(P)-binding protein [Hypoxylon sp. FL1150]|nr:NAD(P)-binding protein [Hypoxylon sp. FL1150]